MSLGKLSNSLPASFTTSNATFALAVGMTLSFIIGAQAHAVSQSAPPYGGDRIDITFAAADFANIGAATAAELIAVLNRELANQAFPGPGPAAAVAALSGSAVKVSTVRLGQAATIDIVGGTALSVLGLTAGLVTGTGLLGVGAQPSAPVFYDLMTFAGDASYPTGGTLGFGALIKAFFKNNRQVLAVIGQDCGGYSVCYLPATDALKVYASGASGSPGAEVTNATSLSGVTFNCLVVSA